MKDQTRKLKNQIRKLKEVNKRLHEENEDLDNANDNLSALAKTAKIGAYHYQLKIAELTFDIAYMEYAAAQENLNRLRAEGVPEL